jgi:hypothetical protein
MDDQANEAVEVLLNFSAEMKAWNDKYYLLMNKAAAEHVKDAIAELKPIFDRHVWEDAARRDERLNAPSTSEPSEYDPDSEIIADTEISKKKVLIRVQTQTGFKNEFRYTISEVNSVWKIKRKDVFMPLNNKWKCYHI